MSERDFGIMPISDLSELGIATPASTIVGGSSTTPGLVMALGSATLEGQQVGAILTMKRIIGSIGQATNFRVGEFMKVVGYPTSSAVPVESLSSGERYDVYWDELLPVQFDTDCGCVIERECH